jgi:hypothetical protein
MAEVISIKERIELLDLAIVQAIQGIGTVYRFDQRGIVDPTTGKNTDGNGARLSMQDGDAMIVAGDETAAEGGEGNDGTTDKTLPIEIHVKIDPAEDDGRTTSSIHNAWLLLLETALMANPTMVESDTEERLAIDSRVTHTAEIPIADGQREATSVIRIEHTYQHYRADPTQGPGITAKEI